MRGTKNKRPSLTQVRKSLLGGLFDPREPGVGLALVINDSSNKGEMNSPYYFRNRAIEFLKEAQLVLEETGLTDEKKQEYYEDKLNKALALIALAKIT